MPASLTAQPSSLLSSTSSQYATPRISSPQPSNLSTLSAQPSFKTARSSISPNRSTLQPLQRDFAFLLRPEIYHPLTNLDTPPPFRSLSAQVTPDTPLQDLLTGGHFRIAAIKAAQLLATPGSLSTTDYTQIFDLVYTRLSCLTLCNQTALAAQEVKALEDLNSSYYRDEENGTHLVPWELRVLAVRLQGMGFNDARRGVMGYYDLARDARFRLTALKKSVCASADSETTKKAEIALWDQRLSELGVKVASALIEMEDFDGAAHFLLTLSPSPSPSPDSVISCLQTQKALLWLCLGDVEAATSAISTINETGRKEEAKLITALTHMAEADFTAAVTVWRELVESNTTVEIGENAMYTQNLGVCLLYIGQMAEAKELLESLIDKNNYFHALTFNLTTIYELCTERSRALKIGLAEKVASMMNNGEGIPGEKVNADFKL